MIRVLIADDEPLARGILRQMLAAHPDLAVVGESASGTAALRDIHELRPDLLLLDVQMPGMDGFEVLRALQAEEIPRVIFVTAFDHYAVKAFEVRALDYLLKPFDEQRLGAAVARVRAAHRPEKTSPEETSKLIALLEDLRQDHRYAERLAIRTAERTILLPVARIDLVQADGKYLRISAGSGRHVMRETLQALQRLLNPRRFLRVSRSAIVNIASIRELQPWSRGEYLVVLTNGEQVQTTRTYRDGVERLIRAGSGSLEDHPD